LRSPLYHETQGCFKPFGAGMRPIIMAGVAKVNSWDSDETDHDESELVQQAQSGDVAAFEALYRRHHGRIYGLVWRLCGGSPALADDLLQEAFVKAWSKLDTFRGDSRFGTWLHRVSVNVALSDRRIRVRKARFETEMDETYERTAVGATDVPAAQQNDLEQAIASLPERARTVLLLHDVEGYRHREIAEMTGMAEGSSKAHLHRARKLVRRELEK